MRVVQPIELTEEDRWKLEQHLQEAEFQLATPSA
jgi:hypothetical protein